MGDILAVPFISVDVADVCDGAAPRALDSVDDGEVCAVERMVDDASVVGT
jgi:hypothetical protein